VTSDEAERAFDIVTSAVGAHLSLRGFKARRRLEWRTPSRVPVQRVTLSLLRLRGTGSGYVEAFAGVNFPDLERLAAELQQSKVRPEFFTCSRNLGLLRLGGTRLQWLLASRADLPSIVEAITGQLDALLPPFFEDFASLASLMPLYDAGDPRVCAGHDWHLRHACIALLLGQQERGERILERRLEGSTGPERSLLEHALTEARRRPRSSSTRRTRMEEQLERVPRDDES
jgi:hypothetical protein